MSHEAFQLSAFEDCTTRQLGLTKAQRARFRTQAIEDFPEACKLASAYGMTLICNVDSHYQLRNGWLIDIYPGSRRVNSPATHSVKAPDLGLSRDWTLVDVVRAAIKARKKRRHTLPRLASIPIAG